MTEIIYLHGFATSADSTKASQLNTFIKNNTRNTKIHIPNLENNISDAVMQIESLIKKINPTTLMGSSLGGFYGTYFSEKYNLQCIGINPAVMPLDMSPYLGENKNYHTGKKFIIDQSQLDLLKTMGNRIKKIKRPNNFMILLQSNDELLNYLNSVSYYKGALLDITFGGNHSFEEFEHCLEKIKIFSNMH